MPWSAIIEKIGRLIAICLLAASLSKATAQQTTSKATQPADVRTEAATVDYGETFIADGNPIRLKRIANEVVVKHRADRQTRFDGESATLQGGRLVTRSTSIKAGIAVWRDENARATDPQSHETLLALANNDPDVEFALPVYVSQDYGLRLFATDELTVQLVSDVSAEEWQEILRTYGLSVVEQLDREAPTYVVKVVDARSIDPLALSNELDSHPLVNWAAHNFPQEVRLLATPTDPFFAASPQQWHLSNPGFLGGKPGADVKAPGAWTGSQPYGSAGIVIAVLDNGVETAHPDLAANIRPGYDFRSSPADSDPNPTTGDDNHGTAVAGVAAASANTVGGVGVAPNVKILPIRMLDGSYDQTVTPASIATAVMYAADNADIINCSWSTQPSTDVTQAFNYAATTGRGGKGAIAFCAAGNNASRWKDPTWDGYVTVQPGKWKFRFEMKNTYNSQLDSRLAIAQVKFPDGSIERFATSGLPSGWSTPSGSSPWSTLSNPADAYGTSEFFLRSAEYIPAAGSSSSVDTKDVTISSASPMTFKMFIENPNQEAVFTLWAIPWNYSLGQWETDSALWTSLWSIYGWAGSKAPMILYPACLPTTIAVGATTDWDFRADYSCFQPNPSYTGLIDFVAPSGGGFAALFTTDRTNTAGYNGFSDLNYSRLTGTSMSTPIAAGIGALILTRNGNLTATTVADTMRSWSEKVGPVAYTGVNGGRNDYYGYGRLRADWAVAAITVDTTAPTFTSASVQTTRAVDLVFTEPMGGAIYTPSSYTITGAGKGTLANNPSQVIRLTPSKYRLVWNAGEMVVGGVTIATTGLQDVAGNNLTGSTSTTSTGTKAVELVNCGGSTVFPFGSGDPRTPWLAEDTGWVGNTRMLYTTSGYGNYTMNSVNTSEVTSPAPTGVYQTARAMYYNTGWATYTLKNVLPNETVKVRLHFNEFYGWSNAGDQIFHIRINNSNPGTYPDLPNYDIMNYTGVQMNKADIREFTITNGSGPMIIQLQPDQGWTGNYNWTLNGIEVVRP